MFKRKNQIYFLSLIIFASIFVYANKNGKYGRTLKDSNKGCSCHNEIRSNNVIVKISGPAQLKSGQVAEYTVTITGGPMKTGGVNISTSAGLLKPVNGLTLQNGELVHSSPKFASGNKVSFIFSLTAPANVNRVIIYATGNSTDNDGTKRNDYWNFAENFEVTIKK